MAVGRKLTIPVYFEDPSGDKDCTNDTFTTAYKFDSNSLRVYMDSLALLKDYDFEILPGNQSFRILIDQTDRDRLHILPCSKTKLWAHYLRG